MARKIQNVYSSEKNLTVERLKELFENVKVSDLSQQLEVTSSCISYWKTGQSKPDTEKLLKICEMYGVTTDWLLGVPDAPKYREEGVYAACKFTGLSEEVLFKLKNFRNKRELENLIESEDMEQVLDTMASLSGSVYGLRMMQKEVEEIKSRDRKEEPFGREKLEDIRQDLKEEIKNVRLNRLEMSEKALEIADSVYQLPELIEESRKLLAQLDEEWRFFNRL